MSANILFRQVKPIDGKDLPVFAPSRFIEVMTAAFGSFPCVIGQKDVAKLQGMAAMCEDGAVDKFGNPFEHLIEAVETLGNIEVWAQY